MVTTKLNLSMTEPSVRQIYAKQGDTGRVLDISLDQTPEDGTLRILRPDGVEVTSEAVTGGEVESGGTFDSLTEADVTELTVGIEPVQDLSHGDPSPSNICPITGHDEVRVTDEGKNLLDNTVKSGQTLTSNGVSCTINSDGSVAVSGTATSQIVNAWFVGGYGIGFKVKRFLAGTYTFTDFIPFYHYVDETILRSDPTYFYSRSATFTFTKDWWLDGVRCPAAEAGTEYNLTLYPQLELGSTRTSYEPYQGSTYTTSLGQTVYGGTLDMVTGVLTVDKVGFNPQLSTFNSITHYQSSFNSTNGIVSVRISNSNLSYLGIDTTVATLKAKTISTLAPIFSGQAWNNTDAVGKMGVVGGLVFDYHYSTVGLSEWTTVESTTVNAFYNTFGSSLFIVAPLASPQTYQLTPQQIKTLVGTNNVWASSGDIVSIKFAYGGLLSELPSDATSIVGKCYCDIEQNGVSSMPFTLNVKKNERES